MAKREKMDSKRSNGVIANVVERRSSQPMSHAVALAGLTISLLSTMRRGNYLCLIVGCTIECMHQCDRTHGQRSNAAL
jgi:uncharacterized metal-binding protein